MESRFNELTHLDSKGEIHMVDVSAKTPTVRRAVASSIVSMAETAYTALTEQRTPKGDVLATVRLAAIMACKKTSELIPLCHPLPLESVACQIEFLDANRVEIRVTATTSGKTGVEMEALTGASVGALTLYDMLKSVDKTMVIGPTRLLEKDGGKSGSFRSDQV